MIEPSAKRTVAFVDGQNLYHAVREAFGYTYPNYDILALAKRVCDLKSWSLQQVRFYTGVPDAADNAFWNHFWTHKLAQLGREGVWAFSRPLRYRNRRVKLPDGTEQTYLTAEEKGVDVRLALDVIRMAYHNEYDVALLFSQDQDLSEVAIEVREVSREQSRWMKVASAYPKSLTYHNSRGVDKTDWIPFDRAFYETCLDSRDYRPKKTT